jgi:hypothetical protein
VADPAPRPKYEYTLCRQAGWLRSVVASNVGAESNFEVSPEKTKVGCWPELLEALEVPVPLVLIEEGRKSAQGTATCLPPVEEVLGDPLEVLDDPPGVEAPPDAALLVPRVSLVLVLLLSLVALELEEPLGLVALPELLEAPELRERIAKSTLPAPGLIITSLMVPSSEPEVPVTWAPINWLARNSWPMRPVGLKCRLVQPDWLLDDPEE